MNRPWVRGAGGGAEAGGPAERRRPPGLHQAQSLGEGHGGQADDFWQYALFAAVACIRAAASQASAPVRRACQDRTQGPGHPAP